MAARGVLVDILRRRAAVRSGDYRGLVPALCAVCKRPIATTKFDQQNGEPPVLLDVPEREIGWTCTECAWEAVLRRIVQ
jgi:hypothetical protein